MNADPVHVRSQPRLRIPLQEWRQHDWDGAWRHERHQRVNGSRAGQDAGDEVGTFSLSRHSGHFRPNCQPLSFPKFFLKSVVTRLPVFRIYSPVVGDKPMAGHRKRTSEVLCCWQFAGTACLPSWAEAHTCQELTATGSAVLASASQGASGQTSGAWVICSRGRPPLAGREILR